MTLTIQTEQDEQRQLLMTIEVPEDRVQKQMRLTARKLAGQANVPGFRKGKAPYHVIVQRVGKEVLRSEAIEELLQPVFEEALEEVNPDIYAQAQFDDMELEPLVLKFTIPLTPEVELGDYRSIRKEIEPASVTDEALEEALENARARHQELEEVERAVAEGDLVVISGKGELIIEESEAEEESEAAAEESDEETAEAEDDTPIETTLFDTERLELVMDSSKLFPGTDFVANLVGLELGDTKEFNITFPDDFEDEEIAGKEATFAIEILQVQNRILPELDDELAKEEGFESLEDMREKTLENLKEAAEAQAQNDMIEGMIDDVLEMATLVYPPAAVEQEIDGRVENFKNQVTRSGWEWEDFLKLQSISEDKLRDDFRENAAEAVERQLVLRQIVLNEKIQINDEDLDAKIEERIASFGDNETLANSMRDYYKQGAGFDMLSSEILIDKVAERIKDILSGNAPDLAELEAEDEESDSKAEVDESGDEPIEESGEESLEEIDDVATDDAPAAESEEENDTASEEE